MTDTKIVRLDGHSKVTVCDQCLRASCWQAVFYCADYWKAGTVEKTVNELVHLGLEHPQYWSTP